MGFVGTIVAAGHLDSADGFERLSIDLDGLASAAFKKLLLNSKLRQKQQLVLHSLLLVLTLVLDDHLLILLIALFWDVC